MDRETYLREAWAPFPPAQNDWMSAADFETRDGHEMHASKGEARAKRPRVCGRLSQDENSRWRLESGGASIEFQWSEKVGWLREPRVPVDFSSAILRDGDLVCIELERDLHSRTLRAEGVLLLVPSRSRPSAPAFTIQRSRQWADFLSEVRSFFKERGFIEAQTPTLVPSPGTEPFLDPFTTEWFFGSKKREFFLPTSPEFHLKKMLVRGWTRIFEFKTCFRNGEISSHHQPEFLMLEWYRAYANLDAIADDVEGLVGHLASHWGPSGALPALRRTTMAQLFSDHFDGFRLTPTTSRQELVELAQREGVPVDSNDTWDDVFFRLFLEKIERELGQDGPLLVRGYPPSQAALSRIGDDGFADRFEVYWKGLELANAFHELNDPFENEARFRDDARKKLELGKKPVPVDDELVRSLWQGMPPSGGIALGLDRLFMALYGLNSIEESRAFPVSAPE